MASPWIDLRRDMPITERWVFLDHAAVAPLPRKVHDVMLQWLDDAMREGGVAWRRWADRLETVRKSAARLLGCEASEIALVRNTTEGINFVAEGFPWREGDNVVMPAGEFPSNLYPWMNLASRGVELRIVEANGARIDLNRLAEACDERTRIVAGSWISYATGWRNDVAALVEIAHRRGGLLFLDAIQGLGAFPLDVAAAGVDFLAADGHKWLLGPEGAGLFFLRREHLDRLRPLGLGWNSVVQAGQFDNTALNLKPTAGRYEGGTYPMAGMAGLGVSLDMLLELGVAAIGDRILQLTDVICRRLQELGAVVISPRDTEHRSGIVSFELPGREPVAARRHVLQQGVVISCRAGRLRISPHAYNDESDIERLIAALQSC